jgi:hypothetical protein
MEEAEKRPRNRRRHLLSRVLLIVLLLVVIIGCISWRYSAHQNAWGKIRFQEYAPSYLPDELSVISKSIDARYTPVGDPTHTTVLDLKLSQHSFIYEKKYTGHLSNNCGPSVANMFCSFGTSPHGQRFLLTTTSVPGQPTQQSIEWFIGNTDVYVNFYGEHSQPYSSDVLGKIVDSFHATQYLNLPINYYNGSKI